MVSACSIPPKAGKSCMPERLARCMSPYLYCPSYDLDLDWRPATNLSSGRDMWLLTRIREVVQVQQCQTSAAGCWSS